MIEFFHRKFAILEEFPEIFRKIAELDRLFLYPDKTHTTRKIRCFPDIAIDAKARNADLSTFYVCTRHPLGFTAL